MLLFVVVNITYDLECIKVKPLFHITLLLLSHSYHRVSGGESFRPNAPLP